MIHSLLSAQRIMSHHSRYSPVSVSTILIALVALSLPGCDSNSPSNSQSQVNQSDTPDLSSSNMAGNDEASFQNLGSLPGGNYTSRALGVSPDGSVVVGWSGSSNGSREAFRWTETEGMTGLGDLPGGNFDSFARGTSNGDAAVWGYCDGRDDNPPPPIPEFWLLNSSVCWWKSGELLNVKDYFPNSYSVNDMRNTYFVGAQDVPNGFFEAARWYYDGSTPIGLGDLPGGLYLSWATAMSSDASVVIGESSSGASGPNGAEAFRWTESNGMVGLGDLPGGGFHSRANDVSADGSVVVGQSRSGEAEGGFEAFRWENGTMIALGSLPEYWYESRAYGVSADGSVVVGESSASHPTFYANAFIWTEENGIQDLKEVLENEYNLDLTDWTLQNASDISDDGKVIVGWGFKNGATLGWRAYLGTPLPDPCDPICPKP